MVKQKVRDAGTPRATVPAMIGKSPTKVRAEFGRWFREKYARWRRDAVIANPELEFGQQDFAQWLGISQSLTSFYMGGQRVPRQEMLGILAAKLGDEIYDILGYERPDRDKITIDREWPGLPVELRADIARMVAEAVQARDAANTQGVSSEAGDAASSAGTTAGAKARGEHGKSTTKGRGA